MTRASRPLPLVIALAVLAAGGLVHARPRNALLSTERGTADVVWVMVDVTSPRYQGDAHLVVGPEATVLIDAGEHDNARSKLLPFLRRHRVRTIDAVLVTHPHFDHMGGVLALLESDVTIRRIHMHAVTREQCATEPWGCRWEEVERLHAGARSKGIPLKGFSHWSETRLGAHGRLVKLIAFEQHECPVRCDINDTSLIARLDVHGHRVLFTGDLNRSVGNWLVRERGADIAASFLKVPHHGTESTASDEFFRRVAARYRFVPSPTAVWCSKRSARIRAVLAEFGGETFVSEPHGDVSVHFFGDGSYLIRPTRPQPRPCE